MVGGKKKVSNAAPIDSASTHHAVGTSTNRDELFEVCYTRRRPTYEEAKSGSARNLRNLLGFATQPPCGYGLFTDLTTGNKILNVRAKKFIMCLFANSW